MPLEVECSLGPARGTVRADRRLAAVERFAGSRPVDVAIDTDIPALHAFILARLGSR
jgi:pyrimidine-specific ribonucleoside hydrolase